MLFYIVIMYIFPLVTQKLKINENEKSTLVQALQSLLFVGGGWLLV